MSGARPTSRTPTTASARSHSSRGSSRRPSRRIATCTASRRSCRPAARTIATRSNGCSSATASSAARWPCAAPRSRRRNTFARPSARRVPWWPSMRSRPTGASGWASTVLQLGSIARGAGRLQDAAGHDGEALRVLSELVATDETNSAWQRELASAQVESARLRLALGEPAATDRLLKAAFATLAREGEAGRGTVTCGYSRRKRTSCGASSTRVAMTEPMRASTGFRRETRSRTTCASARTRISFRSWAKRPLAARRGERLARPAIDQLVAMGYHTPDFAAVLAATNMAHLVTPHEDDVGTVSPSPPVRKISIKLPASVRGPGMFPAACSHEIKRGVIR